MSTAVVVANKAYDGTAGATVAGCTVLDALAGEDVACTGTAAFDEPSVGTGKTVTVTGITLSGPAASNYILAGQHRDDDGRHHRCHGDGDGDGGEQGLRRDDDGDGGLHADRRRGRRRGDVHRHGELRHGKRRRGQDGDGERADAERRGGGQLHAVERTSATTTAAITAATLTATVTAANKIYDGTTAATLTSCTLTGVVGADVVTLHAARRASPRRRRARARR